MPAPTATPQPNVHTETSPRVSAAAPQGVERNGSEELPTIMTTGAQILAVTTHALPESAQMQHTELFTKISRFRAKWALQVEYTYWFVFLSLITFPVFTASFIYTVVDVWTVEMDDLSSTCQSQFEGHVDNVGRLFWSFMSFIVMQVLTFIPEIAGLVAHAHIRGGWVSLACHVTLHWPLWATAIVLSMLAGEFIIQLVDDDYCDGASLVIRWPVMLGVIAFLHAIVLACAHHRIILNSALQPSPENWHEAMEMLVIYKYDDSCSALFAEGSGKYSAQCAICLTEWETNSPISVTRCAHAFHTDCLRKWLMRERTCAMCRREVYKPP